MTPKPYANTSNNPKHHATDPENHVPAFKPYLQERMAAGVWNAAVLLKEIQERGFPGNYTTVRNYLQPLRHEAHSVAVRRFETPPGHQAQVDWGDLGEIVQEDGACQKLYAFVMTLGYSRACFCAIATDQKLPTFVRMHEDAFTYLGGVPAEVLYDNTKTVVLKTLSEGVDGRGESQLNPAFADFSRYWDFTPRLCRPYRPQTKGKVENGIGWGRGGALQRGEGRFLRPRARSKTGLAICARTFCVDVRHTPYKTSKTSYGSGWHRLPMYVSTERPTELSKRRGRRSVLPCNPSPTDEAIRWWWSVCAA